jgi:histidyl-tRNA synthetase
LTQAPTIVDSLCDACRIDFDEVRDALGKLNVPFVVDKQLVRGLDYYTRTAFEIQTTSLGAQSAVAGGGRYDNLAKELGGPDIPATGFAIGFDRLAELCGMNAGDFARKPHLFIAALGKQSQTLAFEWLCGLGLAGVYAEMDLSDKSLKSQMKRADRLGSKQVLIVGDKELDEGAAILRDMDTKEQESVPLDGLVENLIEKIRI